ncbi:MAG: ankyrin repeat domain-containing protein [Motiliproteus sp.]
MLFTKSRHFVGLTLCLLAPVKALALESCERNGEVVFTKECIQAILEQEKAQADNKPQQASPPTAEKNKIETTNNDIKLPAARRVAKEKIPKITKAPHQLPVAELQSEPKNKVMKIEQLLPQTTSKTSDGQMGVSAADSSHSLSAKIRSKERVLIDMEKVVHSRSQCKATDFISAAEFGKISYIQECKPDIFLLEATDIRDQSRGRTALHWAVHNNHLALVKYLIEVKAPLTAKSRSDFGGSPIHIAAEKGLILHVKLLLENGASVATSDLLWQTPLHRATKQGQLETVKYLLEKGASINARDRIGRTPLITASRSTNLALIRLLIQKGGDINLKTNNGMTALHYAAQHATDITQYLLKAGAELDPINNEGETPLSGMIGKNISRYWESIQLLIQAGASLNQQDMKGRSILDLSLSKNHLQLFELLIENNVDTSQLLLEQLKGKPEFIQSLQKHGIL